nr:hypothetical protein [Tanacetum cinerariifolium]
EKRKEKKRKKDKKDKEKKDGKEKKDKDRSKGNHKDKKDKKDKHRDKNKYQEKSKSSTPDEKKIYGQFEGCNGEKLYHNNEQHKINKVAAQPPPPVVVNKVAAPLPPAVTNKGAAPSLPVPKKKPPVPVKPPVKPPHPDTKYLNQILSVPKPDQLCGDDDLEWLYNRKEGKKPPAEEVQVWSEAKQIESVGVWALPYVIPY